MSSKRFKKSISITTGGWSGMATPAVAAAAVHSTAPWYWSIGPLALLAVGFVLRRSRRGGGGPPGQGPFGGLWAPGGCGAVAGACGGAGPQAPWGGDGAAGAPPLARLAACPWGRLWPGFSTACPVEAHLMRKFPNFFLRVSVILLGGAALGLRRDNAARLADQPGLRRLAGRS
jgi:hypothetical protein